MKRIGLRTIDVSWRALVVAIGYTLTLAASGLALGTLGLVQAPEQVDVTALLLRTFVGGLVMSLLLGMLARQVPASAARHVLIWGGLTFANLSAVIIEGYFFAPGLVLNPGITLLQQLPPCLVTAWLVYRLFAPRPAKTPPVDIRRPRHGWLWRFGLSAATYLAAYWAFGAIDFALVTRPYYEAQGSPLTVPDPQTILQVELIRAVLIVLSLLPFLLTAQMPMRRLAVWSGLLLFVIGGIVPLTWQVTSLPLPLLLASAVEIFFQNFTAGMVTALLLARPPGAFVTPRLRHI